jgi:hypothetical protein
MGTLLSDMSVAYKAVNDLTAWREWHKQTIISSQFLTMGRRASGLRGRQNRYHEDSVDCTCKYGKEYYDRMLRFYDSYNPDIEKEWFSRALNEFATMYPDHSGGNTWKENSTVLEAIRCTGPIHME